MDDDPTEEEERLAEELVDEAIAFLDGSMTAREREAIRTRLIDELLFTSAGRLKLKAVMPGPVVDRSGEVARADEPASHGSKKKAGSSS